jgi:transcriptional regulator with XRE-family HTH domain
MTGAAFRRFRKRLGLTQAGLAARMGVHWNAVARWERDERPISELVARFVRLLVATEGRRRPKRGGR